MPSIRHSSANSPQFSSLGFAVILEGEEEDQGDDGGEYAGGHPDGVPVARTIGG